VEVASNDSEHGEVRGGGSYYGGETARIEARPSSGYRFVCWNDSVTDNPRTIVVTQDTAFTAVFGTFQGVGAPDGTAALFTLTPNPARESVTVTLDRAGLPAEITVYDAAGHAVLQRHATARRTRLSTRALPSGHYFVTVATPRSTSTQKLVID
jgi:hypothetical protein